MCGIYGTTVRYSDDLLRSKLNRTAFRGPDFQSLFFSREQDAYLALGHNRLSIVDLDTRSNQPFSYQGKVTIAFNGEIYNFLDVRKELETLGFTFTTSSDTEVICVSYLAWGHQCLAKLNGMFAFVIYDHRTELLFGARDRLGKKPFYYHLSNEGFEFASQLSSIQLGNDHLSISSKSITRFLSWGNIPDPDSIFNEIKKLRPGHYFTYDLQKRQFAIDRYWDISTVVANSFKGSYSEAVDEVENIIKDAVKIRLFADVPLGIYLSGGIDSSLVSALAAESLGNHLKTFSISFNESKFDESQYARTVAQHIGSDHHTIDCSVNEALGLIDNFSYYFDEPFADASALPSMLLAKKTKDHVTVALSGDGGDEGFLGYKRYDWINRANLLYRLPPKARMFLGSILQQIPNYKANIIGGGIFQDSIEDLYLYSLTGFDREWIDVQSFDLGIEEVKWLKGSGNLLQRMGDFDLVSYLNWDINTKVDRSSMAFSLETRAPLLDYRVIEAARSLPVKYKFHVGTQKMILKDILYKYVPRKMFDRPKSGFSVPLRQWFQKELKEYVLDNLALDDLKKIPGIIPEKVQILIHQHMSGKRNRYPEIWKLLVLKQWLENNGSKFAVV
ncbi:asparagine synthase (glutamine-hydrolyzing) [Imperialibacter roseus]|uniref:asparagine synthase (glutamine-hydrolyzing) n=1 Tax=Imperialibacter roseus TaxID=1324217 RepID=A0ABZ0IMK9_9BACT|nr:asparagine synthase (glutamine-hydrolyzing) [Imperialibacter roseus]WOK06272.1 asparagine synthase (glutamine-hydrolyzing) [Imperialibacter roseus]